MENGISLMVMSPEMVLEECSVKLVRLPGRKGPFTVLKNHAPLISVLDAGDVEYETMSGEVKKISINRLWRSERIKFRFAWNYEMVEIHSCIGHGRDRMDSCPCGRSCG